MDLGKTYHVALSVDVDRFTDAKLRRTWLRGLTLDGKPATVATLRQACAAGRARGWAVFPPCESVGADGSCLGHEEAAR